MEPATVVLALAVGGMVGCAVAVRVNMIQIPAMVAFQHGAGGIAAFLTSFVELTRAGDHGLSVGQFSGVLGIIIGAATFSGSLVASAKLAGVVPPDTHDLAETQHNPGGQCGSPSSYSA